MAPATDLQDESGSKYIARIFLAVFLAGISSLQMELSLLREATFVLGGTAFTNSFIISIFLGGLAVGAYAGTYLVNRLGGRARQIFVVSQLINIAIIVAFVYTRGQFLYGRYEDWEILTYFGSMTIGPAIIAGMAFSLFLNMLYGRGEKYIAAVYAVSTIGNVLSGFVHGIVLVPTFGMAATYIVAAMCAGFALLLVVGKHPARATVATGATAAAMLATIFAPPATAASPHPVLFHKHDIHGLVQVIDRSEDWESYDGRTIPVDLRINNHSQNTTRAKSLDWLYTSVDLAMEIVGERGTTVLNAGYASGASVNRFLRQPHIERVLSIDMNKTVLEAAAQFFPEFHQPNLEDSRCEIVIDEFRSHLKSLPDDEKFDIVMVDISTADPYYAGIFTREFFREIKDQMSDRAVMFWHKPEFVRTGADVFDYIYTSRHNRTDYFYFFTTFELPSNLRDDFRRVFPLREPGTVYADHSVYRLDAGEMSPLAGS